MCIVGVVLLIIIACGVNGLDEHKVEVGGAWNYQIRSHYFFHYNQIYYPTAGNWPVLPTSAPPLQNRLDPNKKSGTRPVLSTSAPPLRTRVVPNKNSGNRPVLPTSAPPLRNTLDSSKNSVFPCITPESENAYCTSLFTCPGLMKLLATLEPSAIKYVKSSICLGCRSGDFMVCCGRAHQKTSSLPLSPEAPVDKTSTSQVSPASQAKREQVLKTLIPDRRYCGLQHTDDRYYNETVTALDEFPWLVHIKFTDILVEYKLGDRCTGVLINTRYVLTDVMCGRPSKKVRLGQYDVAHKVTCLENPEAHECTEGTIEIRIEKKIRLMKNADDFYALMLLRLASEASYSDFVRPICLPFTGLRPTGDEPLTFSGWGANPRSKVVDDAIKKRLMYDTIGMNVCLWNNTRLKEYFQGTTQTPDIELNCYSPQRQNRDTACPGDHGGPLMYPDSRHQWYVRHVVAEVAGAAKAGDCDRQNPVIAINITPTILNLILDNIEP